MDKLNTITINNSDVKNLDSGVWSIGSGNTKVVITGCVHGDETVGIGVIQELISIINSRKLIDTQIIFCLCNLEAIKSKKRYVEYDMNRRFSEENLNQIIQGIFNYSEDRRIGELLPYLSNVNYLFDVHSTILPSIPFIYCSNNNKHIQIASYFDVKYIVSTVAEINYPEFFCGLDNYIDKNGGIGMTIEAGSNTDSNQNIAVNGILEFLVRYGLYAKEDIVYNTNQPERVNIYKALFADSDNCKIVNQNIKNFDKYKPNQIIANDNDLNIVADRDCVLIFPKQNIKSGTCYGLLGYTDKTKKLWSKNTTNKLDSRVSEYIFSANLISDRKLLRYDVQSSIAHVEMLNKIGIIGNDEVDLIKNELLNILELHKEKKFNLDGFEDVHSAIEFHLIDKLGDSGKKIHTARSRNDQVLTALRLFSKDKLISIRKNIKVLASTIYTFAKEHEFIPMPGFTHMQYAMPSSIGQWSGSFIESLLNDLYIIDNAILINNQNPLGSGAGFGTSINIDREYTTKAMNFGRTQRNSLFCQNSRGKFELYTISCLYQVMMTLSKIANDIVIFASQEFQYLQLSDQISTGSSIMPQKRNPDPLEVVRGKCSKVFGYISQIGHLSHNLISGYNKDLKFTKDAIIDALEITAESLDIMNLIFENIVVSKDILHSKFENNLEIFFADIANELVMKNGLPFRDAYLQVKELLNNKDKLSERVTDVYHNLISKQHIGATGNLCLEEIINEINDL